MRLTAAAAILGIAAFAAPAFAGPAEGGAIFDQRCKMCHTGAIPQAPTQDKLALLDNAKIIDALTNPAPMMAGAVSGLSDEDKRNVAVFLTKKSLPAEGSLPEVKAE